MQLETVSVPVEPVLMVRLVGDTVSELLDTVTVTLVVAPEVLSVSVMYAVPAE